MVSESVGKKLKKARTDKGLTQIQVMNMTNINHKTLSGYENGVSEPDLSTLKILADLYEVTTDYLMGRSNTPTAPTISTEKEPTTQELEEFLRTSNVQFNGAPLDDKDKEELLEFLRYAWHKLRQKKE